MIKFKCKGCNCQGFKNSQSLSVHFQHNKQCKQIHYMFLTKIQTKNKYKVLHHLQGHWKQN